MFTLKSVRSLASLSSQYSLLLSIQSILPCLNVKNAEKFAKTKQQAESILGKGLFVPEKYNIISELTSEKLMANYQSEIKKADDDSYYSAEFWLELACKFNPKITIPEEFTRLQKVYRAREEAAKWRMEMESLVLPSAPVLPFPSYTPAYIPDPTPSYSRSDEDEEIINNIVSEYWANVAAQQAASDIENMWSELDSMGFWDDKSWQ